MMIAFFVCVLNEQNALIVLEKFHFEDEGIEYMKQNPGSFLLKIEEP